MEQSVCLKTMSSLGDEGRLACRSLVLHVGSLMAQSCFAQTDDKEGKISREQIMGSGGQLVAESHTGRDGIEYICSPKIRLAVSGGRDRLRRQSGIHHAAVVAGGIDRERLPLGGRHF